MLLAVKRLAAWRTLGLIAGLALVAWVGGSGLPLFSPVPAATAAETCTPSLFASASLAVRGQVLVNVMINGAASTLVLDTGAERSVISPAAARRLAVTTQYDFARPITGIGSHIPAGDARLSSFSIGGQALEHPRILVGDVVSLDLGGVVPDGLLGADLLSDFDLDLDLPRRTMTLYTRQDCTAPRPAWPGHYSTIETTRSLTRHPFFPVLVDGHAMDATVDSGAQRTVITLKAAGRAGVGAAELARDPAANVRGAGAEIMRAYIHPFRETVIAGERLRNPAFLVLGGALPAGLDMVIGLDYLQSRRIWLSYGSRRIFVAR